jgi:MOSC domain-containing protein YiiM/DNA-binding XRE family transcriptional regulator
MTDDSSLTTHLARLGAALRARRTARGWTLEDLARRTGLSKAHLSRLEAGDRQASLSVLLTLARAHGVALAALLDPAPLPAPGLVSVNVSAARSALAKRPVAGAVQVGARGLEGDARPERAVCVYPMEHYPYWNAHLKRALSPAAFGEDFTVWGLTEHEVCIGDVYRVGAATVQVSAPRGACDKLGRHHRAPQLGAQLLATGFTGFYCRVLEGGAVQPGEPFALLERAWGAPTVAAAARPA